MQKFEEYFFINTECAYGAYFTPSSTAKVSLLKENQQCCSFFRDLHKGTFHREREKAQHPDEFDPMTFQFSDW